MWSTFTRRCVPSWMAYLSRGRKASSARTLIWPARAAAGRPHRRVDLGATGSGSLSADGGGEGGAGGAEWQVPWQVRIPLRGVRETEQEEQHFRRPPHPPQQLGRGGSGQGRAGGEENMLPASVGSGDARGHRQ
ncbi:hypothetical protein C7M84_012966 [Penaeus vannamei]|uniref:Uncharacterized protein n=1 Tax=Penaeus vannamei TaxID=6689 RepID=A0A3R7MSS0_PENVA|nr:hypothetical protein C7M84_012966 [Penaeus vannamei]